MALLQVGSHQPQLSPQYLGLPEHCPFEQVSSRVQKLTQQLAQARQQVTELEADKAEAQQQIAQLSEQIQSQDTEELYRMFTYGGIVAGAGVLLGIIVTFIPKRRRRNDTWM